MGVDIRRAGNRFIVKINPAKTKSLDDFSRHLDSIDITHRVAYDLTDISPENFYGASLILENPGDAKKLSGLDAVETRVTDLHSRGIYGSGVKVAFLDSGIDCGHPALGGGFGPGYKIGFGYDLVGDDFDGSNSPVPDSDPYTKFHGTHVAGIVGANDVGYGFQGIAPNATLGMYLLGCAADGSTDNDIMISALLMAVRDGADVVSVSIAGRGGWSKGDALSNLVNDLVGKGLTLLLGVGNEGSEGLFYAGSPAAATNSMAVGSVESKRRIVFNLQTSSGKIFPYHSNGVLNGTNLPLYVTSPTSDRSSEACRPLPASTPSLAEHIVVIQRGDCNDAEKVDTAVVKGATRILFYMNSTELVYLPNFISGAQVATLTKEDGESLVSELRKNPTGFQFWNSEFTDGGGLWSIYDSMNSQPNFLGVGRDILSTFPRNLGSYAMMSGTSTSTPQVAGITALIKGFRGKDIKALKLKAILSTTAQQVPTAVGSSDIQTTIHAGGGLVDAFCACYAKTALSIDALALRDIPNLKPNRPSPLPTRAIKGLYDSGNGPGFPSRSGATESSNIHLGTEGESRHTCTFTLPTGLSPERLPVYSGYISVLSDVECERHTLPYYGIAGVLKNARSAHLPPASNVCSTRRPTSFSFLYVSHRHRPDTEDKQQQVPRLTDSNRQPLQGPISFDGNSGVALRYRLAFGSPYMRVDVISANSTLVDAIASSGPIQAMPDIGAYFTLSKGTFLGANLIGMLPTSNFTYVPRTASTHTVVVPWNGTIIPIGSIQTSSQIPSGYYKMLIRALRVNGNPYTDADFDYWVSPAISVFRSPGIQRPNTTHP
ncbi:hypothetical protein H4Q26_001808 [Puccinia striiformis f. sp. tritici PST-130]|nr:hypothetical protein H4Q26_001808 [Puccinia striiformis f. sp. tritici PST-130]